MSLYLESIINSLLWLISKFNFHFTSNYAYFSLRPCCVVKYSRSYDSFRIRLHFSACNALREEHLSSVLQFCHAEQEYPTATQRSKCQNLGHFTPSPRNFWSIRRPLATYGMFISNYMIILFFLSHRIEKIMIHEINFGTMYGSFLVHEIFIKMIRQKNKTSRIVNFPNKI